MRQKNYNSLRAVITLAEKTLFACVDRVFLWRLVVVFELVAMSVFLSK